LIAPVRAPLGISCANRNTGGVKQAVQKKIWSGSSTGQPETPLDREETDI